MNYFNCSLIVLLAVIIKLVLSSSLEEFSSQLTNDLIEHKILPKNLESLLRQLSTKCRSEVEETASFCLKEYKDRTIAHQRMQFSVTNRVSCCHVWRYHNCVLSAIRSRARVDGIEKLSCTEDDEYATEKQLNLESRDQNMRHACHRYRINAYACDDEPMESWLLVLLWVVGGIAVVASFSGALCMLYLFIVGTSRRGEMPQIFIVRSEATKSLINNMHDCDNDP